MATYSNNKESVIDFLIRKGYITRGKYGDFLYRIRKRLGKTRDQVCKETGLPKLRLSKLEAGTELPEFKDLILLNHAQYKIQDSILLKFNPDFKPETNYLEQYLQIKKKKIKERPKKQIRIRRKKN